MDNPSTGMLFTRHNRPLHTLWLDAQAWFCAHELGRMAGRFFDERCIRKLDPDQHRVIQLFRYGQCSKTTMVSESGAYTLLAHHYIPENRSLRRWLTHEVVETLRSQTLDNAGHSPRLDSMTWPGGDMTSLLYWRSEPWMRIRDMPRLMAVEDRAGFSSQSTMRWLARACQALRFSTTVGR
ncbi:Bro-N domain-containing protein [Pseudomonas sp. RP23018S]|uniref:BRO-N domain-containing protein n=1 Tax=Pseudomonas sp. RP23018S TaxID=3096037 RepID=UPI002AC9F9C1|nr:Bro-N domain-containing protein [Pseudomonas sp. RP23018S]MDZ5601955.1 Bro-N domain-containing protein [Pseudomonas sp. RP23018S]